MQKKYIESDFAVGKITKEKRDEMLETFVRIMSEGGAFDKAISDEMLVTRNVCSEEVAERHV